MKNNLFIIIPCYNGSHFIKDCLLSVKEFIIKNNDRKIICIFVDDGSTDNSRLILEDITFKNKDIIIEYLYKDNGGLSSARNYGIKYINNKYFDSTNYVLFLDVDDYLLPVDIDISFDKDINIYNYQIENKKVVLNTSVIEKLSQFNPFVVSCIISKVNNVFFDETLTSLEDWDFWITKILQNKSTTVFHQDNITRIRKVDGSMSSNINRMHQNRVLVAKKHLKKNILNTKHLNNFLVNQMFENFSYKKLIKAFVIIFPYILRRNYLALIKNTIIDKIRK